MLPLPSLCRASLVLCLATALSIAASAEANWLGTPVYQISLLVDGSVIHPIDGVNEIEPGDVVYAVTIGDPHPPPPTDPLSGEVTVVGEGSAIERAQLGNWYVDYGTGNVQSTYGIGAFRVGSGTSASSSAGVLHILSSDVEGGGIKVYKGTLTVDAGARVQFVEVYPEASAYVTLGSRVAGLQTQAGAYAMVQDSIVSSIGGFSQRGTVIVEDSIVHSGFAQVVFGGDVEFHPLLAQVSRLEVDNQLDVNTASLRVISTVVETGSIFVSNDGAELDVASSEWENADSLRISSGAVGTTVMRISGGSRFHNGGTVRVSGVGDAAHLLVAGSGTEFEVEGDLRIGEYPIGNNTYPYFGNATVADGATVIVHGELAIRPDGVLNLEPGGTVYAASLANEGTIHQNGGTLVVPEAGLLESTLTASLAIGVCGRRRRGGSSR